MSLKQDVKQDVPSRKPDVEREFTARFGYQPSDVIEAPGRVNLIGDHTDYCDGFVFPAAIDRATAIACSVRDDRMVRAVALDCNEEQIEIDLDNLEFNKESMWINYIGGTLLGLETETDFKVKGMDIVIAGNVPLGSGLSSSASVEIATLKAAAQVNSLPLDGVKAALVGQWAENNYVGCNCGIMDQLISAMGAEGSAMLLDCRSLTFEDVVIPSDLQIVIVNSNVPRGLVDSEYNTRREQCESVAAHFGVPALRDVTLEQLEAGRDGLDEVSYRRARHVITENDRTQQMLDAVHKQDMARISELMKGSHYSLKDDFEVTTKELDGLVEMIEGVIGTRGGTRMTGGGFGGCVVALVPSELVDDVIDVVDENYQAKFGIEPTICLCSAGKGAFR